MSEASLSSQTRSYRRIFQLLTQFPNAACGTALIDRVIHHADVIAIEGQSYRRRAAEENASSRWAARAKK